MNAYQHAAFGLVFDQLLNLFKGRKNFPEGMGVGDISMEIPEKWWG